MFTPKDDYSGGGVEAEARRHSQVANSANAFRHRAIARPVCRTARESGNVPYPGYVTLPHGLITMHIPVDFTR